MPTQSETTERDLVEEVEELLAKISPWPWTHFYPEHREAGSGVIRPAAATVKLGNVTIDSAPAIGIRYQVEGQGVVVNGQDRHAVATVSPPRSRNSSDWDRVGKDADNLAFIQTKADGDLIARAPELLRRMVEEVKRLRTFGCQHCNCPCTNCGPCGDNHA